MQTIRFLPLALLCLSASGQQSFVSPQLRYAAVSIGAYTPVATMPCSTVQHISCVGPSVNNGPITGITVAAAAQFAPVYVMQRDSAICRFDNQPVMDDTVMLVPGYCHDTPLSRSTIPSNMGITGRILATANPDGSAIACPVTYCAYVNIIYPGAIGSLTEPVSADQAAWITFIQANQLTSAGPQGNPGTPATPNTASAPLTISGNNITCATCMVAPIANASLANASTTVNGQTCTLGGSCSVVFPATYYTPTGTALTGIKHMVSGAVATSASGAWSITYSAVGCTTIRSANVSVISPTGTLATQQYTPYIQTLNTTTVSGVVYSGAVLSLLGATLVPITVATTVYADVLCN